MPNSSCEVVCSQDALQHAGSERYKAIVEAVRVLKPGGRMVFMDVMIRDDVTAQDFAEVGKERGAKGDRCEDGKNGWEDRTNVIEIWVDQAMVTRSLLGNAAPTTCRVIPRDLLPI